MARAASNAGNTNTVFNPGNVSTGWLNTGNAPASPGNTGAFISDSFSNGVLWQGDYEGL